LSPTQKSTSKCPSKSSIYKPINTLLIHNLKIQKNNKTPNTFGQKSVNHNTQFNSNFQYKFSPKNPSLLTQNKSKGYQKLPWGFSSTNPPKNAYDFTGKVTGKRFEEPGLSLKSGGLRACRKSI
jgi:hypothetical protein